MKKTIFEIICHSRERAASCKGLNSTARSDNFHNLWLFRLNELNESIVHNFVVCRRVEGSCEAEVTLIELRAAMSPAAQT